MGRPLVSVGIPVFNGEAFLGEAIESILQQTYDHFELIIADNGSCDRSLAIAKSYERRDRRIKVLESQSNRGASWNFNRLVDAASGDYFKWMAADDLVTSECLIRSVNLLSVHPSVVLAYAQAVSVAQDGAIIGGLPQTAHLAAEATVGARVDCVLRNLKNCTEVFGVIRIGELRRTRRIDRFTGADIVLLAELAMLGRFSMVPDVTLFRREHPARSMSLFPDPRLRVQWFDPERKPMRFPKWHQGFEIFRSIGTYVEGPTSTAHCAAALGRWGLANARRYAYSHLRRVVVQSRKGTGV